MTIGRDGAAHGTGRRPQAAVVGSGVAGLTAAYLHPRGLDELKPMLGGRLHAQHPDDDAKRYYTYRNRGYLVSRPGMRRVGLLELPRFAWYFLVTRRDPTGFAEWVRLLRQGRAERFDRF